MIFGMWMVFIFWIFIVSLGLFGWIFCMEFFRYLGMVNFLNNVFKVLVFICLDFFWNVGWLWWSFRLGIFFNFWILLYIFIKLLDFMCCFFFLNLFNIFCSWVRCLFILWILFWYLCIKMCLIFVSFFILLDKMLFKIFFIFLILDVIVVLTCDKRCLLVFWFLLSFCIIRW